MKSIVLNLVSALLIAAGSQAQQPARGIVFHDLNANGVFDKGEPGIPGVAISNGSDVVLTGQHGQYTLNISDDAIIFVIKPGNYDYPVNELNLPQFWYIHKPAGSPELKYPGVKPTGALPASIDFGLLSGDLTEDFSLVILADPQTYTRTEVDYYETAIADRLSEIDDFSFGITLGDIVGDDLSLFEPINQATAKIGKPWFHVFGNHDMNFDAKIRAHADETFERVYGPSTYAFNHGKAHFIILNDVIYPNTISDHFYVGGIEEEQFQLIKNSLNYVPHDHLIVLCMHIPLYIQHEYGETFLIEHRNKLFEVLKDRPFTLSMSGHTHTLRHYYFDESEGWMQDNPHHHYTSGTASGDWWSGKILENGVPESTMYDGTPNGYSLIQISGNRYSIEFIPVNEPAKKMRIYGPKIVPKDMRFRGQFYVNFFQGSEKDTVYYRLNDGEWRKMRYAVEFDPHVCAVRYEWDHAEEWPGGTRPSNPVLCYHLWKTRIPTAVHLGTNRFTVKVVNHHGREFWDEYLFEVVELD